MRRSNNKQRSDGLTPKLQSCAVLQKDHFEANNAVRPGVIFDLLPLSSQRSLFLFDCR
jgi:hypothetical protein